jgi:hypothetical protein
MMWTLQKETGWTDEYILWGTSWLNLRLKLADAPYYSYRKSNTVKEAKNEDELIKFLSQTQ